MKLQFEWWTFTLKVGVDDVGQVLIVKYQSSVRDGRLHSKCGFSPEAFLFKAFFLAIFSNKGEAQAEKSRPSRGSRWQSVAVESFKRWRSHTPSQVQKRPKFRSPR